MAASLLRLGSVRMEPLCSAAFYQNTMNFTKTGLVRSGSDLVLGRREAEEVVMVHSDIPADVHAALHDSTVALHNYEVRLSRGASYHGDMARRCINELATIAAASSSEWRSWVSVYERVSAGYHVFTRSDMYHIFGRRPLPRRLSTIAAPHMDWSIRIRVSGSVSTDDVAQRIINGRRQ